MVDRVFDLWAVYDNKEKVICLVRNTDAKDLCDLLNELHEENKKLKPVNEMLQMDLAITERNLMEENEQLKSKNRGLQSELQIFKEDVTHSNLQINKLADENEQLKLISNHRGEMVSFATSLIQDMGSEEMLKMWNDFTEVMYQKWKKKRGIK